MHIHYIERASALRDPSLTRNSSRSPFGPWDPPLEEKLLSKCTPRCLRSISGFSIRLPKLLVGSV